MTRIYATEMLSFIPLPPHERADPPSTTTLVVLAAATKEDAAAKEGVKLMKAEVQAFLELHNLPFVATRPISVSIRAGSGQFYATVVQEVVYPGPEIMEDGVEPAE